MTKVDIGVATAPNQTPAWWNTVMTRIIEADRRDGITIGSIRTVSTAVTDHSKNQTVAHNDVKEVIQSLPANPEEKDRNTKTDSNRVLVAKGFLSGDADWLWFLDDDTIPPEHALYRLLRAQREMIAGVYFLAQHPHNPIFYTRLEDGLYQAYQNYPYGAVIPVDSVGMGCTLIHRTVFERIQDGHIVMERPTGSLVAIPKDSFVGEVKDAKKGTKTFVKNGVLHMPLKRVDWTQETRPYPFYAFEYGRTEDHHFCELANNVGIQPYVDTSIECDHIKYRAVTRKHNKLASAAIDAEKRKRNGSG